MMTFIHHEGSNTLTHVPDTALRWIITCTKLQRRPKDFRACRKHI